VSRGPNAQRIFAACAPGLEPTLARELAGLGLDARAVPGGCEAAGEDALATACLAVRSADSVVLRLYQGPSNGLEPAMAQARSRFGISAPLAIRRRGGEVTVSLDGCGSPLYKRGWRARVGAAPLRETLAAALLLALDYDGSRPFLDPMCGSGTIAIEAALLAARRPPGLGRRFAFEEWPDHDPVRVESIRKRLGEGTRPPPCAIQASDRNGGAVRLARKNAEAAGVSPWVRIERADATELVPPPGPGLCLVNPPYGVRLGEEPQAAWRALASLLPRLAGWTLAVLAPDRGLEKLLGRSPSSCLALRNGGLHCRLLRYDP
jgi:putative N6-adenine-specific DNA methylase